MAYEASVLISLVWRLESTPCVFLQVSARVFELWPDHLSAEISGLYAANPAEQRTHHRLTQARLLTEKMTNDVTSNVIGPGISRRNKGIKISRKFPFVPALLPAFWSWLILERECEKQTLFVYGSRSTQNSG